MAALCLPPRLDPLCRTAGRAWCVRRPPRRVVRKQSPDWAACGAGQAATRKVQVNSHQ